MHRLSQLNGRSIAGVATAVLLGSGTLLCAAAEPVSTAINRSPLKRNSISRARLAMGKGRGPYAMTPERRALLNTIRYAEGTWKNGEDKGYRILYGGGEFQDFPPSGEGCSQALHQRSRRCLPVSSATGRRRQELKLRSFEPAQQDQAAPFGQAPEPFGNRRRGLTPAAATRSRVVVLSTWSGHSAYSQPVKTTRNWRASTATTPGTQAAARRSRDDCRPTFDANPTPR